MPESERLALPTSLAGGNSAVYTVFMSDSLCFFGIDGGGTHSRLALTDINGKVIATANSGSTNIFSAAKNEVFENISNLLDSGLKTAGLGRHNLAAGCIGSAGLGREREQKLFREFFDSILQPGFPVKICGDAEILLCGALAGLEGYCLIAGTGSIAMGRCASGGLVRSGGHGYMLGDEGSAAWIGRTAIARTLRSLENRDLPTGMAASILEATGLSHSEDLVRYVHHDADKAKIAKLAPVVDKAGIAGDILATDILNIAATELAMLAESVITRLPEIKRKELALAGGVIENSGTVAKKLKEALAEKFPGLSVFSPKGSALEGASILAMEERAKAGNGRI